MNRRTKFIQTFAFCLLTFVFAEAATAQKLVGPAKTAFWKKCENESTNKLTLVSKNKNMSVAPTSEYGHCSHSDKDL